MTGLLDNWITGLLDIYYPVIGAKRHIQIFWILINFLYHPPYHLQLMGILMQVVMKDALLVDDIKPYFA